jgi:serine/threonine protein kinase
MNATETISPQASASAQHLVDQIAEEFVARLRRGERPPISEYESRYPEQAAAIRELFPTLVMMEQLKPASVPVRPASQSECASEVASLGKLGDYRIVREVGRGGMGIVYEAVQESLGRQVALKVLPKQRGGDDSRQARFEREARAAARLHHTNIVPVFGVGAENGLHYYAMQYIHGLGLDEVLRELKRLKSSSQAPATLPDTSPPAEAPRHAVTVTVTQALLTGDFEAGGVPAAEKSAEPAPATPPQPAGPSLSDTAKARLSETVRLSESLPLPGASAATAGNSRQTFWQSVARIGVQVGEALHYAHEQGVLHRDIKPSNLLLDTRGTVWVTDFGLAKANDQRDLTETGDVLGTLRYMAPEMFSGQADRRSDVYSLGLSLYELLALRPAFDEADRGRLVRLVLHESPPRLRTLDPAIPRDLETIVHKAIDREPSHRYASAQELADDLQRFLSDEPIHARRVSLPARFTRWCKRNPAGAAVVALLVIGLCSSIAAAGLFATERNKTEDALADSETKSRQLEEQNNVLKRERRRADDERERAEQERQRAEENHRRAREAVDRLLTKVARDLEDTPQMEQIRRALLEDALEFYQVFLKQKGRDPTLRYETGLSYFRVADIERQLSRASESIQNYDEATKILQALADEFPTRAEYREQLAHCHLRRGTALARLFRHDEAEAAYKQALAGWESLVAERPDHPACLEELARVNAELGGFWSRRYFFAKGLTYLTQADELLARLARDFPNYSVDPNVKLKVPDMLRATAHARGQPPEAIRRNQQGYFWLLPHDAESLARYEKEGREFVMHWEQLSQAHPDVPDYRKQFHEAAMSYGRVLMAQDRFEECELLCFRQLTDIQRLVAQHPDVPEYRVGMMWNEFALANLLHIAGRPSEAIPHYRIAIDTATDLVEKFPAEPRYLTHLGSMLIYCPAPQFRDGEKAATVQRRALQLAENAGEWGNLGRALMLSGRYEDSLRHYARARELGVLDARIHIGEAFIYCHLGRLDEARKSYELAIDWLDSEPNTYWYMPETRILRAEFEELLRQKEKNTVKPTGTDGVESGVKPSKDDPEEAIASRHVCRCVASRCRLQFCRSGGAIIENSQIPVTDRWTLAAAAQLFW